MECGEKLQRLRDSAFGLLGCSTAVFFFLSIWGQWEGEAIRQVIWLYVLKNGMRQIQQPQFPSRPKTKFFLLVSFLL